MSRPKTTIIQPPDMVSQEGVPGWLTKQWYDWIHKALSESELSQAEIGRRAGMAPGYINHMRKGTIPRREVAAQLGAALGKPDECLLAAGYLPHRGYLKIIKKGMSK